MKVLKHFSGKNTDFSTNGSWLVEVFYMQKVNLDPFLITYTTINECYFMPIRIAIVKKVPIK